MTIDLNGNPLTIRDIHQMLAALCNDGEVMVVNCCRTGPAEVIRVLGLMKSHLSDEDKQWIQKTIREELKPNLPWVTT